jgi:hypothetical protein
MDDTSTEEVYYSRGYNRGVANQTKLLIQLIEQSDLPNKAEVLEFLFSRIG